jgi:hypothetical protein
MCLEVWYRELVFVRLVGLADRLIGLLIEKVPLIAYIREKHGANQDKSPCFTIKASPAETDGISQGSSGVAFPAEAGKRSLLLAAYCFIRLGRRSSAPCW